MKNKIPTLGYIKFLAILCVLIAFMASPDAMGQRKMTKSYIKRQNKKIGKYRGGSIHFDINKRYLSGGFSMDALNYFGDLAPTSKISSTNPSFTRPAFSIFGIYKFHPNIFFRASFSWGRLKGDDYESSDPYDENSRYNYVRNASFRNDIKELAVVGIWDIFPNHGTFLNRLEFTPYVFAGVAIFHHNPKGKVPELDKTEQPLAEAGQWVALKPLGTEGQLSPHYDVKPYSLIQPSIPVGMGMRAKLNNRIDVEFEVGYRYLFTDYIDDVSGMYVDLGALDSDLARAMSDRSTEPTAIISGELRDFDAIYATDGLITYTSQYDNQEYTILSGRGRESQGNNRGFPGKDIYIVTSFKLSYVLTGSFKKAKFR